MRSKWIIRSRGRLIGLAGVLACGLLAFALLGLASAAGSRGARAASQRRSDHANRLAAQRVATRLLEETPLPEGAEQVGADESALSNLTGPASSPQHTAQFVGRHKFWRVAEAPEAVIDWIDAHPPAGSKITMRGTSGKSTARPPRSLHGEALRNYIREHSITTEWDATFSFPPSRERLATVWLSVSVAAAKGGGSEIRADAIVVWRRVRPAAEHIPRKVKEVGLTVRNVRKHVHFTRQITSPGKVAAIVAVIEGLQRPEGGAALCPEDNGREPIITLRFRKRRGTPPVVRVRIDENGCGSVQFFRGYREEPELGPAYEATKQLRHILGGSLTSRRRAPLKVQRVPRRLPARGVYVDQQFILRPAVPGPHALSRSAAIAIAHKEVNHTYPPGRALFAQLTVPGTIPPPHSKIRYREIADKHVWIVVVTAPHPFNAAVTGPAGSKLPPLMMRHLVVALDARTGTFLEGFETK